MGVINQVLTGFFDETYPLIGYDNFVTTSIITSTTAATGFPVTNLANPATHLRWTGTVSAVDGMLLHFDGTDAATTIADSSANAHTFTVNGNAQLDTSQFKFGTASLLLDGTGDYILGDGSSDFAFGNSGDWTIDFWVRWNSVAGDQTIYDHTPTGGVGGTYIRIFKTGGSTINVFFNGANVITGSVVVTTGQWYHIAFTRTSGTDRLFINGTQDGSSVADSNTHIIGTSRPAIGTLGNSAGSENFNGWIDEVRVVKGRSDFSANFTVPTHPYNGLNADEFITLTTTDIAVDYIGIAGHNFFSGDIEFSIEVDTGLSPTVWTELIPMQAVSDDSPIIVRFTSQSVSRIRIRMQTADTAPEIAVLYAGEILVLERSITIGRGHVPVTYGRRTSIVNGMSETGNFLGRIVLGEHRQSKAEFEWFTPDFYRSDIDVFLEAAQEVPFFWAWSPSEYPAETGYVWLTNNAEPEVDPVTRRVALTLEMRGIA